MKAFGGEGDCAGGRGSNPGRALPCKIHKSRGRRLRVADWRNRAADALRPLPTGCDPLVCSGLRKCGCTHQQRVGLGTSKSQAPARASEHSPSQRIMAYDGMAWHCLSTILAWPDLASRIQSWPIRSPARRLARILARTDPPHSATTRIGASGVRQSSSMARSLSLGLGQSAAHRGF